MLISIALLIFLVQFSPIVNSQVGDFGQIIGSTFSALEDKAVLKSNTTLYCVSDNSANPEVTWSYTDAFGTSFELASTTNSTSGVSILLVNTTHPGYYSCQVSQDQGASNMFTAIVANTIAVPQSGCYAITSDGACISYFTTFGINWRDARVECLLRGYDLTTITSFQEILLLDTGGICWIGLNDIGSHLTFSWIDGSDATYRLWNVHARPGSAENCILIYRDYYHFTYANCAETFTCYYCGANINAFGQITGTTYSSLSENTVLTSNTTLYCVTENKNTPQVMWSYVDLAGTRSNLTSATDASTGVSNIQVSTTEPGSYTCEVTENGGSSRTYTAVMTDNNINTVPTSGCQTISNVDGTCYSYFTSTGINWYDARQQCAIRGYDLATVTSEEENTLMYNTATANARCWLGLNDIDNDGTFVWADGSVSTYRQWNTGEPNDYSFEDCVETSANSNWNDFSCTNTQTCYFCSSKVNIFGQITGTTYSSLSDNTVLTSNTTLYCVTENKNTPQVMWSYVDLAGTRSDLTSTTDVSTGVSNIQVSTTESGYYTCEVTENGGSSRTYTAVMSGPDVDQESINGCHAISNGGTCYSYFTSTGITWSDARLQCVSRGYDLATITSVEENTLMYSILTAGTNCWIGLNDIDSEETFVWADGIDSTFRFWAPGQPNDDQNNQDCVETYGNVFWNDLPCNYTVTCYFCSKVVNVFGQITGTTYSLLSNNTVLTSNTTLYCVTENKNTPQVIWSYVDLAGTRSNLTSATDASTGVSNIQVSTTEPGYYTCEVTENGGSSVTYTAVMTDSNNYTAITFGQITGTTYSPLSDNTVLTSDTTLYCVTENKNTPQVMWSYVDLAGIRSDLTSTTDASTGVSNIQVSTTEPGYYTCKVTENGGSSRTYTVGILNTYLYTAAVSDYSYVYTVDLDSEDIFLWYSQVNNSLQLTEIYWRRKDIPGSFPNPLAIHSMVYYLSHKGDLTLECMDGESGDNIMSIQIFIQGPPVMTLSNGSMNSFSLLPPEVNRADVEVLTQDVVVSTNLVGKWQIPDDSFVSENSLTFSIFHQADEGLYKFYVTNWNGEQTLAIQIIISVIDIPILINNTSQHTISIASVPTAEVFVISDQLTQHSSYIIICGIVILILLMLLMMVIFIAIFACVVVKRRTSKSTQPLANMNTITRELNSTMDAHDPAYINDIYCQIDSHDDQLNSAKKEGADPIAEHSK